MSSDSKYLSKELNLYSADSLLKLQAKDVSGNFELAYKDLATESRQPIVVKELWIETDSSGTLYQPIVDALSDIRTSVSTETTDRTAADDELWSEVEANYDRLNGAINSVNRSLGTYSSSLASSINNVNTALVNEIKDRKAADAVLSASIDQEKLDRRADVDEKISQVLAVTALLQAGVDSAFRELGEEKVIRRDADEDLNQRLLSEASTRLSAVDSLQFQIISASNTASGADAEIKQLIVDEKTRAMAEVLDEKNRAMGAESALSSSIDAERNQRWAKESQVALEFSQFKTATENWESKMTDRVDFIVSNTNPSALDSLSEIVSHFSTNGQSYADRLTYLENVIESLVNKKK